MLKRLLLLPFLAVLALASAQTDPKKPLTAEDKAGVIKGMTKLITENAFVPGVDFSKWNDMLEKAKIDIDGSKTSDEFVFAVNTALRKFEFSHIVLLSPQAMEMRVRRSAVGIGVQILPQEKGGLLVTRVVPEAPAQVAGILPGDILIEADGKPIKGPEDLRGDEGSTVKVKAKRDSKDLTFTLVRKKFNSVIPEELTWFNPDTAVLKIPTFDISYSTKRVETLMEEASKAKQLVLDLRGNGGGVVFNMLHLLSTLLPEDTEIGTFVNRRAADNWVKAGNDIKDVVGIANNVKSKLRTDDSKVGVFKGKIAVLLDGGSGSASEIAGQALKEILNSPVIGSKSAGAVLASVIAPVYGGFNLQYPIYDYVSIKGHRLEGNGIAPDSVAKTPLFLKVGEKDPGVESALVLLSKGN
jgi:carboxyl-terminal processing protease